MNAVKPLHTQQSSVGLAAGLVACFGLFFSTPARAEDSAFDHENGWEITGSIYVWAPAITGDTIYGPGFEVSFSDILDNLDFGLVGALEGRRGDWMLLGDLLYFDVSAGRGSTRQVGPILRRGSGFESPPQPIMNSAVAPG